jgi:hypothetical protein
MHSIVTFVPALPERFEWRANLGPATGMTTNGLTLHWQPVGVQKLPGPVSGAENSQSLAT